MNRKDFNEDFFIKHSETVHVLLSVYEELSRHKFIEFLLVLNDKFSVDVLEKTQFLINPEKIQLLIPTKENVILENVSKLISFMKKHNKSLHTGRYYTSSNPYGYYDVFTYDSSLNMFICECSNFQYNISCEPITKTMTITENLSNVNRYDMS